MPSIISQQQFDAGTALWLQNINDAASGDPDALQKSFQSHGSILQYAGFSSDQIAQLLSTVGGCRINARFLVIDATVRIALYVSDALNTRLSAYYVSLKPAPEAVASGTTRSYDDGPGTQVDHALVARWLQKWAAVEESAIDAPMFTTSYGPLKGYTFGLKDFLEPMFGVSVFPPPNDLLMRVEFGLHEYYSQNDTKELTQTFGLVVRLNEKAGSGTTGSAAPFFDMTTPCPPICGYSALN